MTLPSQRGLPRTVTTKEKVLSKWKVKARVQDLPSAGMSRPWLTLASGKAFCSALWWIYAASEQQAPWAVRKWEKG